MDQSPYRWKPTKWRVTHCEVAIVMEYIEFGPVPVVGAPCPTQHNTMVTFLSSPINIFRLIGLSWFYNLEL